MALAEQTVLSTPQSEPKAATRSIALSVCADCSLRAVMNIIETVIPMRMKALKALLNCSDLGVVAVFVILSVV